MQPEDKGDAFTLYLTIVALLGCVFGSSALIGIAVGLNIERAIVLGLISLVIFEMLFGFVLKNQRIIFMLTNLFYPKPSIPKSSRPFVHSGVSANPANELMMAVKTPFVENTILEDRIELVNIAGKLFARRVGE